MKSTTYSDKVLEHFKNPRNVGEIENADGIGRVGNPVCGDLMWIYLRILNLKQSVVVQQFLHHQ